MCMRPWPCGPIPKLRLHTRPCGHSMVARFCNTVCYVAADFLPHHIVFPCCSIKGVAAVERTDKQCHLCKCALAAEVPRGLRNTALCLHMASLFRQKCGRTATIATSCCHWSWQHRARVPLGRVGLSVSAIWLKRPRMSFAITLWTCADSELHATSALMPLRTGLELESPIMSEMATMLSEMLGDHRLVIGRHPAEAIRQIAQSTQEFPKFAVCWTR